MYCAVNHTLPICHVADIVTLAAQTPCIYLGRVSTQVIRLVYALAGCQGENHRDMTQALYAGKTLLLSNPVPGEAGDISGVGRDSGKMPIGALALDVHRILARPVRTWRSSNPQSC
jgi:hypothetical protein